MTTSNNDVEAPQETFTILKVNSHAPSDEDSQENSLFKVVNLLNNKEDTNDGSNELLNVTAPTLEDAADDNEDKKKKRCDRSSLVQWLFLYMGLILLIGGTVGGICGGLGVCMLNNNDNNNGNDENQSNNNNNAPPKPTVRPILDAFELRVVLGNYIHGNDVSRYGSTMADWDVSRISDFSNLLHADLLDFDAFNEDLSTWQMGNATNLDGMFYGQKHFRGVGLEHWNVSQVTSMRGTFEKCANFDGNLQDWDTSSVRDMSRMFASTSFAGNVSAWNVSQVTDMSYLFFGLANFNADLSGWQVHNVQNMAFMFNECRSFNQDLTSWNVSQVSDMGEMFEQSDMKHGNVSTWDVSSVTRMESLFDRSNFNGDVSRWNVGNVVSMASLFRSTPFNRDVSNWATGKVTQMQFLFNECHSFDQDLGNWNVQNVISMEGMFLNTTKFQGMGLENWETTSLNSMKSIFDLSSFSGDVSTWSTGKVTDFSYAFYATPFSGDLSNWDTSSGITYKRMFNEAVSFSSALPWNVSRAVDMTEMFEEAASFVGVGLEDWDVRKVTSMAGMFDRSGFDTDISRWNVMSCQDFSSMFRSTLFNYDVSEWNVTSAQSMSQMFQDSSFDQDLCPWGSLVRMMVDATDMFEGTQCEDVSNPVFGDGTSGPWCVRC